MIHSTYSSIGTEAAVQLNSDQSIGKNLYLLKCLIAEGTVHSGVNR